MFSFIKPLIAVHTITVTTITKPIIIIATTIPETPLLFIIILQIQH